MNSTDDSRPAVAVIAHGTPETFDVKSELRRLGGVWRPIAKLWKFPKNGDDCHALVQALAELGVTKVTIKRVAIEACPDCGTFPVPMPLSSGSRVLIECSGAVIARAQQSDSCDISVTGGSAEHAVEVWNRRATDV